MLWHYIILSNDSLSLSFFQSLCWGVWARCDWDSLNPREAACPVGSPRLQAKLCIPSWKAGTFPLRGVGETLRAGSPHQTLSWSPLFYFCSILALVQLSCAHIQRIWAPQCVTVFSSASNQRGSNKASGQKSPDSRQFQLLLTALW